MVRVGPYQTPNNEQCLRHMQAERIFRVALARVLERHHVTVMEWLLLGVVGRSEGRRVRMSAAAEALGVTLPQVTALAVHLLENKLVRQKVYGGDKRGRQLELTGKGVNVLEDAEESVADALAVRH